MPLPSNMRYVPTPIPLNYSFVFSATTNPSGRMQYHRIKPGDSKQRISRAQFIDAFNTSQILAIRPIQEENVDVFQLEFYI